MLKIMLKCRDAHMYAIIPLFLLIRYPYISLHF